MFIEQADGFSMDVAYMKVLPSKSKVTKEAAKPPQKRGRGASGGPPPFCGFLYFLTVLGSTFKNSFKNDLKRQTVGFGVSISLLGYVKSTLNVIIIYKYKFGDLFLRFRAHVPPF